MRTISVLLIGAMLMLTSCADDGTMSKGGKGAIGGAATGAVLGQVMGQNTTATLIGAAMGTVLGFIVGNEMDNKDKQQLNQALETGGTGQPVSWSNTDSGDTYQVTSQAPYTNPETQQKCRKAEIVATIDGKEEVTTSTACRKEDGQWVLAN